MGNCENTQPIKIDISNKNHINFHIGNAHKESTPEVRFLKGDFKSIAVPLKKVKAIELVIRDFLN